MVSAYFLIAALSTLPVAFARYPAGNATSCAPSPSGTATVSSYEYKVAVGKDGLTFTPDTIHANIGDKITFEFFPKNHSVVQSEFKTPCEPSDGAIFSGFVPTTAGPANTTFTITVKNKKPIWLYCPQNKPKPHCAAGMVAVINPPAHGPNTLDAYKELATKTNSSSVPAGGPSGGKLSSPYPSSASSAVPSSPPSSAPSSGSTSVPVRAPSNIPSIAPSGSSNPTPSGTATGAPIVSTGAASSLAVSGAVGMMAVFAGFLI